MTTNLTIQVDEAHIGHQASLLIVAIHTSGQFFMYDGNTWQPWYGDLPGIVMATLYETLPTTLTIPPFQLNTLPLNNLGGKWTIYVGYRVEDMVADADDNRVIIFNGLTPLQFLVANGVGISLFDYQTVNTASHFNIHLHTASGLSGNNVTITQNETAAINFAIDTDPADIGQAARLILTAQLTVDFERWLYIHDGETWQPWDDDLNNLTPVQVYDKLPARLTNSKPLSLDTLPLDTLPATLDVRVGYHLGNEDFIYNGETPLHIKIIEEQTPTPVEEKRACLFCD